MMERVQARLNEWRAKASQAKEERRRLETMREAERRIQVREFDNILCLSIDGIPVLPMGQFNRQTLSDARLTLFNYLSER